MKSHTKNNSSTAALVADVVYFSSARPRTEQTAINKTLKETDEPALHLSSVQHETPQSSPFSHAFFTVSQPALVVHDAVTVWISNALA